MLFWAIAVQCAHGRTMYCFIGSINKTIQSRWNVIEQTILDHNYRKMYRLIAKYIAQKKHQKNRSENLPRKKIILHHLHAFSFVKAKVNLSKKHFVKGKFSDANVIHDRTFSNNYCRLINIENRNTTIKIEVLEAVLFIK